MHDEMRVIGGVGHGSTLPVVPRAHAPTCDARGYGRDVYQARLAQGHRYLAFSHHEEGRPLARWLRHCNWEGKHYAKDWEGQWWEREQGQSEWQPAIFRVQAEVIKWSPPSVAPSTTHTHDESSKQEDKHTP